MAEFRLKHGDLTDLPSSLPEGDHFVATRDKNNNPLYPPEVYMGPKDGGSPQLLDKGGATVNAANYVNQTNNGGEAIQAAINDLPQKGGSVLVPPMGPDSYTNVYGKTRGNVWKATSTITAGKGILLKAPSRGWHSGTGATIVGESGIGSLIKFTAGLQSGIRNLHLGGAGDVNYGIDLESTNDYYLEDISITGFDNGLTVENTNNVWVLDSKFETCGKGIVVNSDTSYLVIENSKIVNSTSSGVKFNNEVNNAKLVSNLIDGSPACIDINSKVRDSFFVGNTFAGDSGFLVRSGSEFLRNSVSASTVKSDYFIDNQGQITDCNIDNTGIEQINNSIFRNVVNDVSNTTRVLIDGQGYNGSNDPSSSGDWYGEGREGIRVLWDDSGTPTLGEYINGSWYNRAL